MLVLNLRNVLTGKGIDEPKAWLKKAGIADDTSKKLLNPKRKYISLEHLEIICYTGYLLPSDIFIWQPDSKNRDIANHPLQEIRSGQPMPDLNYINGKLSLKNIKKAEELMKKLYEEELEERKKKIEERKKKKE